MNDTQTVTVDFRGTELEVTGRYYAGCRAVYYTSNGDGHPAEPAEFDIHEIKIGGVDCFDMFCELYVENVSALSGKKSYEEVFAEIESLCLVAIEESEEYEGD